MSSRHRSIKRRLKRLFSISGTPPVGDSCMTQSLEYSTGTSQVSDPLMTKYVEHTPESSVHKSPLSPIRPCMTQSLTDTDLQTTCWKDCCSDETADHMEEGAVYTRGASRRACVIELGAMEAKSTEPSEGLTLEEDSDSYPELRTPGVVTSTEDFLSRNRTETDIQPMNSKKDKPALIRYHSETSIYGYPAHRMASDKTKSLSRSLIKRLPSRKKARASSSLDDFLQYELKASSFHDTAILFYKHYNWRELIDTEGSSVSDHYSELDIKRLNAVWELFHNECMFLVEQLLTLKHVFLEPLKRCQVEGYLMSVEPFKLFGNLDDLCYVSYGFCQSFLNTISTAAGQQCFGSTESLVDCLENMTLNSQHGDVYHSYLLNYKSALKYLSTLRDEEEEFGVFENFCEKDERCNRLKLTDLLVAPMHHWTRFPLILTRIREYTTDQEERESLDYCIENVKSSLRSLDNKMEWQKTFERVKEIDKQLIWPSLVDIDPSNLLLPESVKCLVKDTLTQNRTVLADQVREILYEGQLILTEEEKTTCLRAFLFSDMLLLTKVKKEFIKSRLNRLNADKKSDLFKVVGQPMPVDSLSVHDISDVEAAEMSMKHAFVLVQTNKFQQIISILTLQSNTSLGKEGWIKNIQQASQKLSTSNNHSFPKRQESFKELFNLPESPNILKNCRVLEVPNALQLSCTSRQAPSPTKSPTSGSQLSMDKQLEDISENSEAINSNVTAERDTGILCNGQHSASNSIGSSIELPKKLGVDENDSTEVIGKVSIDNGSDRSSNDRVAKDSKPTFALW